ncbi:DUF21 domain-containing protein [Telmatospirillum sp. J64-1]|uniref:DUF21 domain-containing protein n=1 Tax=Telmatospirillum sp. J64-1 TaxID=2502183 RepID=UPI00115D1E2E|nr:DUF21 domain-containing protein [Telmatospirillum sp. J64-1]
MADIWIWVGIAFCLSQSAMLSGLNLAIFRLSRLQLETDAERGHAEARTVLALRQDANYTLATILWGNVSVNVLLTLLTETVLAGIGAFFFSTVGITLLAEILPQAYFSQHALRVAALFAPLLKVYRILFWPVAKPVGVLLDRMIGREAITWFREEELAALIAHHAKGESEVGPVEAEGAMNFLALDDIAVAQEGEPIAPDSILQLPFVKGEPIFPDFSRKPEDPFLQRVVRSGKKWIIVIDQAGQPRCVFSAPAFLSGALFGGADWTPGALCHYPLIVRDPAIPLERLLTRLTVRPESHEDDVIDSDVMLVWSDDERRIITGSDLLGRLLRRIAQVEA